MCNQTIIDKMLYVAKKEVSETHVNERKIWGSS